ncbi:MAG: sulfite exporter TauE/SafE family protein [Candidatus Peribacteraceae bacterium]|jgi:sulfite exporter TauE/SafE/copper chaperone CopZ
MSKNHQQDVVTAHFRIVGMHCASCELLLERKLKALPGITGVSVNHRTGKAALSADAAHPPSPERIEETIRAAGYRIADADSSDALPVEADKTKWKEIGASLVILFALWKLLQAFDLTSLLPDTTGGAVGLGGVLLIGLVAGTSSCLAVTGGLLLAIAGKYNEANRSQTAWQKFQPLLRFNIGRLASYFVLGGVVGLIGQSITISARMTGVMNLAVAFIMLWLALSMLGLLPKQSFIRPPKRLSHWIAGLAEHSHPLAPFALGALTFFLPCGFTQSLQLVALASGNVVTGALTMFVFALGTLPSLLGISAVSSTAKGTGRRLFLRFAGTLVLVLALYNGNNALALNGIDLGGMFFPGQSGAAAFAVEKDGKQEVRMAVQSYRYQPDTLTIKAGVPVRWVVDGTGASGCTSAIVIPSLDVFRVLERGENVIEFTATKTGKLPFSCSMGMVRGTFTVI